MVSPTNPTKYVGPNVYLANYVIRNRRPTGADYRQPETGRLYPIFAGWQVGKNPTTGTEGELWLLTKIVANVAFWEMISGAAGTVISITGDDNVIVTPDGVGNIDLLGLVVPNATNAQPVFTTSLAPFSESIEVQLATTVTPTPGTAVDVGLASFNENQFTVDATSGMVSIAGDPDIAPIFILQAQDGSLIDADPAGIVAIDGDIVANGTNPQPLFTVQNAPNTMTIELQKAIAVAPTPVTDAAVGVASFNNTQFTVDATSGMVSAVNVGTVRTLTGDTGGAISPTAGGNINTLGGGSATGINTDGAGNTLTWSIFRWVLGASNNWTPVVRGSGAAGVGTYIKQHGVYTRIGRNIFFTFDLEWSAHTGTGDMQVTGFPKDFSVASTNYPTSCFTENITLPANAVMVFFVGANATSQGTVYVTRDATTKTAVQMAAGAGTICCYGLYFTDTAA